MNGTDLYWVAFMPEAEPERVKAKNNSIVRMSYVCANCDSKFLHGKAYKHKGEWICGKCWLEDTHRLLDEWGRLHDDT